MAKATLIGRFKPYTPNYRADMRKRKQYQRNRAYTDRHEDVLQQKREKHLFRMMTKNKKGEENHE